MRAPLLLADPGSAPCWIISIGKASHGMARAIVHWLAEHQREPAGGIIVSASTGVPPHPALRAMTGDHPIPGARSLRACSAIADTIARIPPGAIVHVCISGGASSLAAGPLPAIDRADVTTTFELLLSSGLDIHEMNAVRKRVTRWSAGRLALQLVARSLQVWVVSDVMGDDLGSIASGPCTGDAWTSDRVRAMLSQRGIYQSLPRSVQLAMAVETPKPADQWLASITPRIVAANGTALAAAVAAATALGVRATRMPEPLHGEAAIMGRAIAQATVGPSETPEIRIWGGETTVTMVGQRGIGGRSQELALAAAEHWHRGGSALLAAGTDGRDGPTDAAGALVDAETWKRIVAAGRDPAIDLAAHDAYAALNTAGALLRTGPTGTNVMDIAFATTGWG